jgi:hypothetical protein
MGIELLLRTSEPTARTIQVATTKASGLALVLESECRHDDDSVRLVFVEPSGKQLIVTIQPDGEIHAESVGRPRDTAAADRVVIEALLPGAAVVGSNPSWDTELGDD